MMRIKGLAEARERLRLLAPASAASTALRECAARLEEAVRVGLSHRPGEEHAMPWLRTGALHDSISTDGDDARLIVGSDDPVAPAQELGTATIPPRSFLAATAAAASPEIAERIAEAIRGSGVR
jgi:phage gpG-like protein